MQLDMLHEYGPPENGIAKGGMIRRLTELGWSDLIGEEVLILLRDK